ncbi:UPF0489 family protein [Bacillus cereus group sp. BfR-BA-01331]|uniref:UPF0489 family protein n=1 Tax=Bacillus cereus group sp. BfR-BA-01331 TaxID=2920307 RepID=UPI001F597626|nr:UPF0489 family protein [Bacillus cereus group sp. BfR-BA-01331]
MVEHQKIKDKDIYIVEHHHHVLEPWAIHRERNAAPILVTLDHHTDCNSAFLNHSSCKFKGESGEVIAEREDYRRICVEQINYNDLQTVQSAIGNLKHDEHIDAAIKSNIIEKAFIINYNACSDTPISFKEEKRIEAFNFKMLGMSPGEDFEVQAPEGYHESTDSMYILDRKCWIGNQTEHPDPCNDNCKKPHYDQAIESIYLEDKLNTINEMVPGLIQDNQFTQEYILDIDLDYFHTLRSIHPEDYDIFYNLIRNAKIITIAMESLCVDDGKYGDEDIDSASLLTALLSHIEEALS